MEVCCALTVVCKLINKDMMPALLPQVLELVQNKRLVLFCFCFCMNVFVRNEFLNSLMAFVLQFNPELHSHFPF